ncbi:ferredoxin [Fonticella tunisiensis]|uniref:Ferredoxin n=1 Tax=Fonticella tunisiensis TaxID=1096341 RepID=A0A4R7KSR9_9CLOT|nr:ferredoxin [Fonticella tunisiensis]TDT62752.1 ferredoxin [Fonticella tunisiensis]
MKGFVDKNICIGCGLCSSICPEVFEMDVDGLAKAKDIDLTDSLQDTAKEAESSCPVSAITIK